MSSKPGGAVKYLPSTCIEHLFRPNGGIATGATRRRDHRRVSGIGRRRADFRIDTGGGAKTPTRPPPLFTPRAGPFPPRPNLLWPRAPPPGPGPPPPPLLAL